MTKFINVTPMNDYKLEISTDSNQVFIFDVLPEIKRIDCYKSLLDSNYIWAHCDLKCDFRLKLI